MPRFGFIVPRSLALPAGVVLLLATGLVHGFWTERWQPSTALQDAAQRLDRVPMTIGDWQGRDVPMDPDAVERSGLNACWTRRYMHTRSGRSVTVVLMCGRAGPTSVHTPEACYGGAGYQRTGMTARQPVEYGSPVPGDFWTADFTKETAAVPLHLRIFWGWGTKDGWSAPRSPRWTFRRTEALYKLYVLRETAGPHEPSAGEPCLTFFRVLLPVLDATLFAEIGD